MKRRKFLLLRDIIEVDDPAEIRAFAEDPRIDRIFKERPPLINALILKYKLAALSYGKWRFPHFQPRKMEGRAASQDALWQRFTNKAPEIARGPKELDPLSQWIKGKTKEDPGVLTQQVIGEFFIPGYKATGETYAAAVTISIASKNSGRTLLWILTGKLRKAKMLLAARAHDDLACIHGTTVAIHNIVAAVKKMKALYADEAARISLNPAEIVDLCLSPPPEILRQATTSGKAGGCPFSKYSLILLKLGKAYKDHHAKDVIFMTGQWSHCPAERWVPAMLAGIWQRARATS